MGALSKVKLLWNMGGPRGILWTLAAALALAGVVSIFSGSALRAAVALAIGIAGIVEFKGHQPAFRKEVAMLLVVSTGILMLACGSGVFSTLCTLGVGILSFIIQTRFFARS